MLNSVVLLGVTLAWSAAGDEPAPDAALPLRMADPRVNCTATPTRGGRILIVGGMHSQLSLPSALGTAELLDPAFDSGAGRVTGPIALSGRVFAARTFHDAVELDDGLVLLVGGDIPGSLEIYDPAPGARGEFRAAGALLRGPRFALTATRLRDGRVFIAGGVFANQKATAKTEIFDPKAGKIVAGPDLFEARCSHTATLLADGRVLLAGGVGKRTTEFFDPVDGTMLRGPNLTTPRDDHRATLLADGRVLFTGGQDEKACVQSTCELFDPRTLRCRATGSLADARADHAQVLLADGSVLVIGGEYDNGDDHDSILASIERFDPKTAVFERYGVLAIPRDDCAAVRLADGRVAVIGGQTTDDRSVASIEFVHKSE